MDRAFYSEEIIGMLNERVLFIIPAVNNSKVKEYEEIAREKGEIEYKMSDGMKYRMVVYEKDGKLHARNNS